MCRFKTSPCVGSERFRVCRQNARICPTCARFAGTHGSVLNLHTGGGRTGVLSLEPSHFRGGGRGFPLPSFSSFVLFLFLFSFSLLSSLSNNDNDHSSSRFSLCTQRSDLPDECQCAWASVHSLFCEHVHILCKKQLSWYKLCKPRATWNEVGLCLCWKWVLCLVVC